MREDAAERRRRAQIVEYWRAVELFSPPKVDSVSPEKNVFAVSAGRPLPWQAGSPISKQQIKPDRVWRHTVYAGVFKITAVRDTLMEAFRSPDGERDLDGRINGDSALLSFTVNEDGRMLKPSAALSACAWAVGRTLSPGPAHSDWLDGFDSEAQHIVSTLLELADGKLPLVKLDGPAAHAAGTLLGPIAGVATDVALGLATGAVGELASAAATALGPVIGPMAGKAVEMVGDKAAQALVEHAVAAVTGAVSDHTSATPDDSEDDDDPDQAAEAAEEELPPADLGTKILTVEDLAAAVRWVAEQLSVAEALSPDAVRVKSYQIREQDAEDSAGDEILNSFLAEDLTAVASALRDGDAGTALIQYLSPNSVLDAREHCDVQRSPDRVLANLQPRMMPAGRWPAESSQPLVLSQQFAINRIMQELGEPGRTGLYAVNGPPGTGKTTMLRDLIAAVVVQRAVVLSEFARPRDAFAKTARTWTTLDAAGKKLNRTLFPPKPELTGFEMVIASSNNGAVQNVTMEVPVVKAVGSDWREQADYLSDPASLLLGTPAWGAIAARLGRRSYRANFVQRFWWGNAAMPDGKRRASTAGLHALLKSAAAPVYAEGNGAADVQKHLGSLSWTQAVDRFRTALSDVDRLATDRQKLADLSARLQGPDKLLEQLQRSATSARQLRVTLHERRREAADALEQRLADLKPAQARVDAARDRYNAAQTRVAECAAAVAGAEAVLAARDKADPPPGALKRMLSRRSELHWEERRGPYLAARASADAFLRDAEQERGLRDGELRAALQYLSHSQDAVRRAQVQVGDCDQAMRQASTDERHAAARIEQRTRDLDIDRRTVREARERWPGTVPGAEWDAPASDTSARDARERSSPWMDPGFAAARTRLFLAALDLHRALLAEEPELMRRNLAAVMDVVGNDAPADLPAGTVLAAWQMLFLIVPVVSSTFASLGRMFGKLGRESLGWVLIDEAGQATPQAAVGALWRFSRAVIVGDPQQLEPVNTLPLTGQKRLAAHFAVASEWTPSGTSAQRLADRVNSFGTWLPDAEGSPVWVGSPLRVHRRCDRLMFEVSNAIAYDGMMVYGVEEARRDPYAVLQRSVWRDVKAPSGGGKWNPADGKFVLYTINLIRQRIADEVRAQAADLTGEPADWKNSEQGIDGEIRRRIADALFVVSPFRDVVNALQHLLKDMLPDGRVGTVHTTQGKEADIVILVLGTAADQHGSRNWAATAPNLLNVAVTRARRRLIVVADHAQWRQHRYFRDLAEHPGLPVITGSTA